MHLTREFDHADIKAYKNYQMFAKSHFILNFAKLLVLEDSLLTIFIFLRDAIISEANCLLSSLCPSSQTSDNLKRSYQ